MIKAEKMDEKGEDYDELWMDYGWFLEGPRPETPVANDQRPTARATSRSRRFSPS